MRDPAIRVILLPRDTNAQGSIFGGVILSHIDLAGVTYIDDKGRDLLVRIIRSGAELRTQGIMNRTVVEEIRRNLNRNERTERRKDHV